MVGIDADVTELIVPGVEPGPIPASSRSSLLETKALRSAGEGRLSPTAEQHLTSDLGRTARTDDEEQA
jgi:hypothetical protein